MDLRTRLRRLSLLVRLERFDDDDVPFVSQLELLLLLVE